MSSRQLTPIWMYHKKNESMTIGMSTETEICQIRGRVSQDLHYWTKLFKRIYVVPEGDWRKSNRHHVQITHDLALGHELEKPLKEEETRMGNRETETRACQKIERSSFYWSEWRRIQRHSKMHGENWRHQRQLQCHAKERSPRHAYGKHFCLKNRKAKASEAKTRFSCITEARDMNPREGFMKNTLRERAEFCIALKFSACIYSNAASDEDSRCKGSNGQGMEKAWDHPSMGREKGQTQQGGHKRGTENYIHFC